MILTGILNTITDPVTLLAVFVGTLMGLIFGSLPGLTATMGVALLIPLTYTMNPVSALGMMLGCFVGGMAGGAVASTLINIPGTPSAVVTTLDGYPMAQQGRAGEALGWAAFASGFGSLISWIILITLAPTLAFICTGFSAPEYAALAFMGLTIIVAVSGKDLMEGILAGLIGIFISTIGVDPVWGDFRFTFNNVNLMSGISLMPALIGFYSIPQILSSCTDKEREEKVHVEIKDLVPSPKKLWKAKFNIIRSSIIGTLIGIIPAAGGSIAAFLSYDQAKRYSKSPETFGKGNYEGVIASEAANNGVCGGALVPLMTLGIPGDPVTAVLLGGLLMQGLLPGPLLFQDHMDVVIGMFTTFLIATIFMVLIQVVGIKFFVQILNIPPAYLSGVLVILSLVGSYALRGSMYDVLITLVLGALGYIMTRAGYSTSPMVLGLVLGGMLEKEMRMALDMANNQWSVFVTRPVPCVILIIAVFFVISSLYSNHKDAKKAGKA